MKPFTLRFFLLWLTLGTLPADTLRAQPATLLTLDSACAMARAHYPLIRQKDLVQQSAALHIANLQKGWLPQLALNGQATWQSDVTRVPVDMPGFSIDPPARDQYRVVADVSQLIYDGGLTREQKSWQQVNRQVENQQLDVELYKLRERVTQVFLGILYTDEQLRQVELVKTDLQTGIKKVEAQVQNGTAFRSALNLLKAEWLKAGQRSTELAATRKGLVDWLSVFTGQDWPADLVLVTPVVDDGPLAEDVVRPELSLFSGQKQLLTQQEKLIRARNRPRASLFAQGGYGRPGLNLLLNRFDLFFMGGLRINWSMGGLYTRKKDLQQIGLSRQQVQIRQDLFLLNTRAQLRQQQADIGKWRQLVQSDEEIIALRKKVSESAQAQLESGVITASDYLREINAEDQARQQLITHRLQWLQSRIQYLTLLGKQ
jgi:outer membrane protein TolC